MKCPTVNCTESLPTHSRRKYCSKCRAAMAYYAKRKPADVLRSSQRMERGLDRISHREDRGIDQMEAVSVARREKKRASKSVRSSQERARI